VQPLEVLRHELRRPLSNLVCAVELLLLKDIGADAQRELLTLIQAEGEEMLTMLDELRACMSRPGRQLTVRPREIDLRALLEEAARFAGVARKRPIALNLPVTLPRVLADPARTRQIVNNLLANALVHTPEDGAICLSARTLPHAVEVSVLDSGVGIEAAALSAVFSRYFHVERPGREAATGDGLGLAIVREIVEAQGGTAWIRSDGPGTGTDVGFTIPRAS
jgi:signal transduction histidine kinase